MQPVLKGEEKVEHRKEEMPEKARELRRSMTAEGKHLWYDFLQIYPVRFRKQEIVGNYILDFYCSKAKLAIEIDGAQHYTPESLEYDKERTEYLESRGIKVIRMLNKDINDDFENACKNIMLAMKKEQTEKTLPPASQAPPLSGEAVLKGELYDKKTKSA